MNESDNRDRSPIVQSREAEIDLETSINIITGENDLQPNNNNDNPDNTPGKILNVVSPIPANIDQVKKRSSKVAEILRRYNKKNILKAKENELLL